MVKCTSKSKDYIDYNCYHCLKNKFDYCQLTENGRADLNSVLDSMHEKFSYFTPKNKVLEELVKHLTCNSVILETDTNLACKYINFWLYVKVKDKYFYNYDSIFKNFEEFVKKFYKVVTSYRNYESCTKSIKIPNDIEYNKMNTLYTLYKKYDDMKFMHTHTNEWMKKCKNIQFITTQANSAAHLYNNDEDFINVLRDLRDIIKKGEGIYKSLCDTDLLELVTMVPESVFPPKKPDAPPPKEISQSPDSLKQTKHQPLPQHVSGNGIHNQSEQNVDLQAGARTVQLSSGEQHTQVSRAGSTSEEPQLLELSLTPQRSRGSYLGESHPERSRHAGDPHQDVYESSPYSRERNELSSDARSQFMYSAHNSFGEGITSEDVITSTEGKQSYFENIKGTLSETLQNIDPYPVLGVSGGMGALFLLFKYTPVGTFFRGRGYRQRIPTRFDGVYPGFLPGFQGFEEGYFPNDQINIAYGRE